MTFEKFGNYLLLERLTNGGMAAIFLARPATTAANGRILVVKRLLPEVAAETDFLKMFQSEIQLCMGLNHPNIVQIYDFGEVEGQHYIAMEYIEGKNLRQVLEQHDKMGFPIPVEFSLSITMQTAAALHYAHHYKNRLTGEPLQVIHRDISPQNILITYDGNVKLIDFGIAKASALVNGTITLSSKMNQNNTEHTQAGVIKGKLCYLSPEQVCEERLDGRTDIFSLGAVLWELLTGRKLFDFSPEQSQAEMLSTIKNCARTIRAPSYYNDEVPKELDAIVLKALAQKREDRYETADAFQTALRNLLLAKYPNTSYRTVSSHMTAVFQMLRQVERIRVKELNDQAQKKLSQEASADVTARIGAQKAIRTETSPSDQNMPEYPPNIPKLINTGPHHFSKDLQATLSQMVTQNIKNSRNSWLQSFVQHALILGGIYSWGVVAADAFWKYVDAKQDRLYAQNQSQVRFASTQAPQVVERTVDFNIALVPEPMDDTSVQIRVNGRALEPGHSRIQTPLTGNLKIEVWGRSIKPVTQFIKIDPIYIDGKPSQTVVVELENLKQISHVVPARRTTASITKHRRQSYKKRN